MTVISKLMCNILNLWNIMAADAQLQLMRSNLISGRVLVVLAAPLGCLLIILITYFGLWL